MLCLLQIPAAMKDFLLSAFANIFIPRGSPNDCDCFKVLSPADHAAQTQVTPCKNVDISLGNEKIVLLVLQLFGFLYTTNNIDPVVNVFPNWFTLRHLCKAEALVVWLHKDVEDPTNVFFSSLIPGDVLLKHRA